MKIDVRNYLRPGCVRGAALAILFLGIALPPAFAQTAQRQTATWRVARYDISARLPQAAADRALTATAKLELKNVSSNPASRLTLRISPSAEITSVRVNGAAAEVTKGEQRDASAVLQTAAVRVPGVPPGGALEVVVDYKLTVRENSDTAVLSPAGTHFLPASFWYPTPNSWFFPGGADNAPFRLQVIGGGKLISSGTEISGGYEQKLFGQPFFFAGDWEVHSADQIAVYFPKGLGAEGQKRAVEIADLAKEAKAYISKLLGSAPASLVRIVASDRGVGFAAGGTVVVGEGAFRREKIDLQTAMAISEGLSKLWLGTAADVTGDSGGVIREGLPKFLATEFLRSKHGDEVADAERARQRAAYAGIAGRGVALSSVSPLDDSYYPEVANKGSMIWRLTAKRAGNEAFFKAVRDSLADANISLVELRAALGDQKEFLDQLFDEATDTNLLAGLPQSGAGETKVALRNSGPVDVTVTVAAWLASGERMAVPTTIRARSFGEVVFKTPGKVVRVEVDPEKLYPQTDYSDDVAPRETNETDADLAVGQLLNRKQYNAAENLARTVLRSFPRFDEVRVSLGRAFLAEGRLQDAEKEFRAVIDGPLPIARSMAWSYAGLADVAQRGNQKDAAVRNAALAIKADADTGASLSARETLTKGGVAATADVGVAGYFQQFDRIAVSSRKADLEAMMAPGEAVRFASGLSGQAVEWKTVVTRTDTLDADTILAETLVDLKLINKEPERRLAVFRLSRIGNEWKLHSVDIFERR
jgi:hypothetical protein